MKNTTKIAKGFTVVEFAITLAVAAVMTSVAIPSLHGFVQNTRIRSQTDELFATLQLARSEAMKRQVNVYVTPNSGGLAAGWWVWEDSNGDGVQQTTESVLAQTDALQGGTTVDPVPAIASSSPVFFKADGTVNTPRLFQLRIPKCSGDQARDVEISTIGKVSVEHIDC